jgi:hypothetical protein
LLGFVAEIFEQHRGDVTLAEAGDDDDDELACVLFAAGDLHSGMDRGAGGDANQQTFFEGQAAGHGDGVVV